MPTLKPLVATLLPFALLVGAAEGVYRRSALHAALRAEDRYTALVPFYEALPFDPDVVIVGDSRTLHGVVPDVVERRVALETGEPIRMFNLGLPGAPPIAHLALVDPILSRPTPPRLVIFHLSPYMFSTGIHPVLSREAIPSLYTLRGGLDAMLAGMPLEDVATILADASSELMRNRRAFLKVALHGRKPRRPVRISPSGHTRAAGVFAYEQHRRAIARARGYRNEVTRPAAEFNWEQYRYLARAIDRLTGAGVAVALVTTPASTPLLANDRPDTTFGETFARVRQLAEQRHVPFHDHFHASPVPDFEFADGDHPAHAGARRYSAFLAREVVVPALTGRESNDEVIGLREPPSEGCARVEDFEAEALDGWTFEGAAFEHPVLAGAVGPQRPPRGLRGLRLLNSYHPALGDRARGRATSPELVLERPVLRLLVGGGRTPATRIELLAGDEVVRSASGEDRDAVRSVEWDVAELAGRPVRLRVIDEAVRPYGFVLLDHVEQCAR